ncbi:MAG: DUF1667 domain-containing protein [Oscillospiraceae bacterium]
MKRVLTCIGCPLGCQITVELHGAQIISVTGNTCRRGSEYARKEVTNPTRIVTSSVPVTGSCGQTAMVSCKTEHDIPKSKVFDVIAGLKTVRVQAPVKIGDVLLKNVAGTGVDVIATKNVF